MKKRKNSKKSRWNNIMQRVMALVKSGTVNDSDLSKLLEGHCNEAEIEAIYLALSKKNIEVVDIDLSSVDGGKNEN